MEIKTYGDSCLSEASDKVKEFDCNLKKTIEDMKKTLRSQEGIGLAAPQVGINLRIFIMDVNYGKKNVKRKLQEFINPVIIDESNEDVLSPEGCLSLPGISECVYRSSSIVLKYQDENGCEHISDFDEILSKCAQHEIGHLNGELFIDKLPKNKRMLLGSKLSDIRKGNG